MAGSNVFIVACDPEEFGSTVGSAVDPSEYDDPPDPLVGDGPVRLFGAPPSSSNRSYFEKMERGDLLLFFDGEEFLGTGLIGDTFEDEAGWANDTFWNGDEATLLYTVEEFTPVSVPKRAVNRIFDYDESYTPRGLMRVADNRVSNSLPAIKRAVERYSERNA